MRNEILTIINQLLLNDGTADTQLSSTAQKLLKSKKQNEYIKDINEFIKKTESEIEAICNDNHHEFVSSVDQLLKVRQESENLKDKVSDLGNEFSSMGRSVYNDKLNLLKCQKLDANMSSAVEVLNSSVKMLKLLRKAQVEIESRRFYHALRTIDEIQLNHLRSVQDFNFAQVIKVKLPEMKIKIKNLVLGEMKDWLSRVREDSKSVGELAVKLANARKERLKSKTEEMQHKSSYAISSVLELLVIEELECNLLDNDQVKISFEPLLQCIHIFDVLDCGQEFRVIFEEDRRLQAGLFQSSSVKLSPDLEAYKSYLQEIAGFFILEFYMMNSARKFRSRSKIMGLWENCMSKINSVSSDGLRDCRDGGIFLKVKEVNMEFIRAMEGYSFNTQPLLDFMKIMFSRYLDLLKNQTTDLIIQIMKDDKNMPLSLNSLEELEDAARTFKFIDKDGLLKDNAEFPKTLPLNKSIWEVFQVIAKFVERFYSFIENNHLHTHTMDEAAKKSVDYLIANVLMGKMRERLLQLKLENIVSVITTIDSFSLICSDVEDLLSSKRVFLSDVILTLASKASLKDCRKEAEYRIFELINGETDRLLSRTSFQWNATSIQKTPTPIFQEFFSYIKNLNENVLIFLPAQERAFICFEAFNHLSNTVISKIINPEVKKLSYMFVENLNLDVVFLESIITKLNNPNLFGIFSLLREIVDLMRNDKFEEYLDDNIRRRKYSQLKGSMVIQLFEKLKDSTPISNSTDAKAKRKNIEAFLKTIKDRPSLM